MNRVAELIRSSMCAGVTWGMNAVMKLNVVTKISLRFLCRIWDSMHATGQQPKATMCSGRLAWGGGVFPKP